jgi:hypothetical protein
VRGHQRVADVVQRAELDLDLLQLDPVAVDLDLGVPPTLELDLAIGQAPAEVTGDVRLGVSVMRQVRFLLFHSQAVRWGLG